MTRSDPQAATGVATYPPMFPPCVCGDLFTVHQLMRDGSRGPCSATTTTRECRCRRYEPDALDGAR